MVKQTFKNLPAVKRQRIENVLLEEFSTYPLADAKVSHIVKKPILLVVLFTSTLMT